MTIAPLRALLHQACRFPARARAAFHKDTQTLSTIRATVHGRVQGVSYRSFALREARSLGVTGFVRNRENRNEVEVVATAGAAQLEDYLARLRRGPPAARVREVTVEWSDRETAFADFAVRY